MEPATLLHPALCTSTLWLCKVRPGAYSGPTESSNVRRESVRACCRVDHRAWNTGQLSEKGRETHSLVATKVTGPVPPPPSLCAVSTSWSRPLSTSIDFPVPLSSSVFSSTAPFYKLPPSRGPIFSLSIWLAPNPVQMQLNPGSLSPCIMKNMRFGFSLRLLLDVTGKPDPFMTSGPHQVCPGFEWV